MGNQNGKKRRERIRIFWVLFNYFFLKKRGRGGAKRMGFLCERPQNSDAQQHRVGGKHHIISPSIFKFQKTRGWIAT